MIGKSLNLQEKVAQFCRKFLSKILSDFDMIHYYYEYRIYYEYIMDMDWSNLESSLPY